MPFCASSCTVGGENSTAVPVLLCAFVIGEFHFANLASSPPIVPFPKRFHQTTLDICGIEF